MIATVTAHLDGELLEMCREASLEIARFDSELGAEIDAIVGSFAGAPVPVTVQAPMPFSKPSAIT